MSQASDSEGPKKEAAAAVPNSADIEAVALGLVPGAQRGSLTPKPGDVMFAVPMEYPFYSAHSRGRSSVFGPTMQGGFVSILYAIADNPLEIWEKQVRRGSVKRVVDTDIRSKVIEVMNANTPLTTFITTPVQTSWTLGIRLPVIVLVLKNMRRFFAFDVQVLDDTKTRHRFRARYSSDNVIATSAQTALPLRLDDGWNQVSMNLADLTQSIYGTLYVETVRVQVYANVRLRRIFFCDKLYGNQEAGFFKGAASSNSARK